LIDERLWLAEPTLPDESEYDFDAVIVGSEYGGAIAGAELNACMDESGRLQRACALERREYLAGSFPSHQANLAGYVRFVTPKSRQGGVYNGLCDTRSSHDAVAVIATDPGSGSLINAGGMECVRQVETAPARNHFECFRSTPWCFRG
jgi:cholesterol oxidase